MITLKDETARGRISAHIAAGAFSGLLLTHHVWERRHSL